MSARLHKLFRPAEAQASQPVEGKSEEQIVQVGVSGGELRVVGGGWRVVGRGWQGRHLSRGGPQDF